jgi:tetratricopeptide (TPR) repeat protein
MEERTKVLESLFKQAVREGQKRNYKKATALLESILLQYPQKQSQGYEKDFKCKVLLYLSRSYHAMGDYAMAISNLNSYVNLAKKDPDGWFFLGRSYLALSSYSVAIQCLKKSLEFRPKSDTTLALLGTAYFKSGKTNLAVESFKEALYINPDDAQINQAYQNSLFVEAIKIYKRGDIELAKRMFAFCINNGMDSVLPRLYYAHCLREQKYLEAALDAYKEAIALAPDDPSLRWYELSILSMMGKTEEARRLVESLSVEFDDFDFSLEKGKDQKAQSLEIIQKALAEENWKEVIEAGRLYIQTFGSDAIIHSFMGEASRNLSRHKEAENHFLKAKRLDPQYRAYRYGLLITYLSMENWEALDAELAKNNSQSPLDEETIAYYSVICDAKLKKEPKTVLDAVQKVFRKNPADTYMMGVLAEQYLRVGLPELSQPWLQKLLDLGIANESEYLLLIECAEQLKNKKDFESACLRYLEGWQANIDIRKKLIRFYSRQEKWKQAANHIETLLAYSKHQETLTKNLAVFRFKARQFHHAAILYRALLQEKPDNRNDMQRYVFCLYKLDMIPQAIRFLQLWHKSYSVDVDGILIEAILHLHNEESEKAIQLLRSSMEKFKNDKRIPKKLASIYQNQGNIDMARQFDPSISYNKIQ